MYFADAAVAGDGCSRDGMQAGWERMRSGCRAVAAAWFSPPGGGGRGGELRQDAGGQGRMTDTKRQRAIRTYRAGDGGGWAGIYRAVSWGGSGMQLAATRSQDAALTDQQGGHGGDVPLPSFTREEHLA